MLRFWGVVGVEGREGGGGGGGMRDGDEGWGMGDGGTGTRDAVLGILWGKDGGMEGRGEIDRDEDSERKGRIKGIAEAEAGVGLLMLLRVCVSGMLISSLTQYQRWVKGTKGDSCAEDGVVVRARGIRMRIEDAVVKVSHALSHLSSLLSHVYPGSHALPSTLNPGSICPAFRISHIAAAATDFTLLPVPTPRPPPPRLR